MPLYAVLPVAAFLAILIFFIKKYSHGFRYSWLWASLTWAVMAVVLTEVLSLFHLLTPAMVMLGWAMVFAAALIAVITAKNSFRLFQFPQQLSLIEKILLSLTGVIIFAVGLNGFLAAPNNWDSMTYHLPRILHWIQNQSVEHYSTPILRQLYQPPGAEFLILQFQILAGNDRFANLVQWFALLGSSLVLSLTAAELGAGRKGQILTAFLAVTIPMGILQGSSTQNDYVAGFWLAAGVYFLLKMVKEEGFGNLIGAALALGLALLTKGTIYIFAVPWIAGFIVLGIVKKRKTLIREIVVGALVILSINAGFYCRNIQLFGRPLSAGTEDYANKGNVISNGMANVVRNAALHMGTPFAGVNQALKDGILKLSGQDADNSWGEFAVPAPSTSEDIAGNPLHFLLIVIVFIWVAASRSFPAHLHYYVWLTAGSFVLFCVLLKWQLFHSRLHLPLFLLGMPVAAAVLEKIRLKYIVPVLAVIIFAAALPPLLYNERHPLAGAKNVFNTSRLEQYFFYRKFMAVPYVLAAKYAASRPGADVGLLLGGDDWEYPLWILLKKEKPDVHIWHSGVKNVSASLTTKWAQRVSVIISEVEETPDIFKYQDQVYLKRQKFVFMSVYENPRP